MLKHATISRTSRAQQALQLHRHWQHQEQQQQQQSGFDPTPPDGQTTECEQHTQQVDLLDGRCHQTTDQAASPANESSGLIVLPVSNHDESVLTNHESSPLLASLPPLLLSTSRMPSEPSSSCCTSPTPSNQTGGTNTSKTNTQFSPLLASGYSTYRSPAKSRSTPSSLVNSPMKLLGSSRQRSSARSSRFSTLGSIATGTTTTTTSTLTRRLSSTNYNPQTSSLTSSSASSQESMIKVFAQALGQDVKYVTLPVNTQTKSQEIIKTLLKKYRQKHRDPNLFHLTLERWIRKDGLKFKSVMLLGDEACPLQLQQCCSNPPHDDIKFTLQMRSGALVKIYCSDVVPDAKYKCLSLSTQTTVEETIELMLHCLNLTSQSTPKLQNSNTTTNDNASSTTLYTHHNRHFSGSPNPSSSSSSSSYDTSSSSGIESEPNNIDTRKSSKNSQGAGALDSDSRASSVASISSSSNVSSLSSSLIDQYCMVIERKNSNFTQTLRSDEYLVDVYQGLLAEASRTSDKLHASDADSATTDSGASSLSHHHQSNNKSSSASQLLPDSVRQSSDQWFFIKLKRRYETENNNSRPQVGAINHVNPRQNMPLPPIPPSQSSINQQPQHQQQLINSNHLRHFVSTTQIEVNRPGSSLAANNSSSSSYSASTAESELMRDIMRSTPIMLPSSYSPHLAAAAATGGAGDEVDSGHQAPPPSIILLTPPVRPRRRNLSNVSSTFVPHSSAFVPPPSTTVNSISNKRRYDQAQLIEDLDRLNIIAASSGMAPVAESG